MLLLFLLKFFYFLLSNLLLSISSSLFTHVQTALELLFNLLTFFVIYLAFMFPLHFASVYKGDLLIVHIQAWGSLSRHHDWTILWVPRPLLHRQACSGDWLACCSHDFGFVHFSLKQSSVPFWWNHLLQIMRVLPCISNCSAYTSCSQVSLCFAAPSKSASLTQMCQWLIVMTFLYVTEELLLVHYILISVCVCVCLCDYVNCTRFLQILSSSVWNQQ